MFPVCTNITDLPKASFEPLPLSKPQWEPSEENSEDFSVCTSNATKNFTIRAEENDAVLLSLLLEGQFTSYQVFIIDENGNNAGAEKVRDFIS